jgi:hypothetical protein
VRALKRSRALGPSGGARGIGSLTSPPVLIRTYGPRLARFGSLGVAGHDAHLFARSVGRMVTRGRPVARSRRCSPLPAELALATCRTPLPCLSWCAVHQSAAIRSGHGLDAVMGARGILTIGQRATLTATLDARQRAAGVWGTCGGAGAYRRFGGHGSWEAVVDELASPAGIVPHHFHGSYVGLRHRRPARRPGSSFLTGGAWC